MLFIKWVSLKWYEIHSGQNNMEIYVYQEKNSHESSKD